MTPTIAEQLDPTGIESELAEAGNVPRQRAGATGRWSRGESPSGEGTTVDLKASSGRVAGRSGGPVRVFVVDDDELVRLALAQLIEAADDLELAGEAGTVREARARIPASGAEVVVVDIVLPDGDGVELCRAVRSDHPRVRCLILTAFADENAVVQGVLAGAAGYVLKGSGVREILRAIRAVADGESLLDPAVTGTILDRVRGGRIAAAGPLTSREQSVLDLIAEGMTNQQIARDLGLAEKTVKNYVSSVLVKLGVETRTQAALRVVERRRHA